MSVVHVVLPHDIDDPRRPSGGNHYDRRVIDELRAGGWTVHEHVAPSTLALGGVLADLPDGATALLDGLIACRAPEVLASHRERLRLVVLVHAPLGPSAAEAAALRSAAVIVATSEWTRAWLWGTYALAAVVATPGVDPAPLATPSVEGRRLLCVGAVTPTKGYDVLAGALDRLEELAWSCRVVGSADVAPAYAARLRAASRRIAWVGPLTGRALADAYDDADLVVLPSRRETYGMVVTEALARGLPVVASDVGGVPEALGTTAIGVPGLVIPPDDPVALDAALRRWLTEPALREQLRHAALARRPALTGWASTCAQVVAALARERVPG